MQLFQEHLIAKRKSPSFARGFAIEILKARLLCDLGRAREKRKWSPATMARRAGITSKQLARLENGGTSTLDTLLRLCGALGLELVFRPQRKRSA